MPPQTKNHRKGTKKNRQPWQSYLLTGSTYYCVWPKIQLGNNAMLSHHQTVIRCRNLFTLNNSNKKDHYSWLVLVLSQILQGMCLISTSTLPTPNARAEVSYINSSQQNNPICKVVKVLGVHGGIGIPHQPLGDKPSMMCSVSNLYSMVPYLHICAHWPCPSSTPARPYGREYNTQL